MTLELNLKRNRYKQLRATLTNKDRDSWRLIERALLTASSSKKPLTPDAWLLELEFFVENSLRNNFYRGLDSWVEYKQGQLEFSPF